MAPDRADAKCIGARPFLMTFSGIDGAGKTTQIEHVASHLQKQGLRVLRFSFWDHVAVWSKLRAGIGHLAVGSGRANVMAERSFVPKNNKCVRKWYLTVARLGLYMLDVARLRRLLASQSIRNADVVIFDRYVYDQIANIDSASLAARFYARILVRQTPVPDLAFVLDASPTAAFARKPEYPLACMHQNRQNFLRLHDLYPQLIIISDAGADDVGREIASHIRRSWLVEAILPEEMAEVSLASALVPPNSSRIQRTDPTAAV